MLPDRVSNPGPLTYESGALLIALRGPAWMIKHCKHKVNSSLQRISLKCILFSFFLCVCQSSEQLSV